MWLVCLFVGVEDGVFLTEEQEEEPGTQAAVVAEGGCDWGQG